MNSCIGLSCPERAITLGRVLHLIDSAGLYGAEKVILSLLNELRDSNYPGILGCISELRGKTPEVGIEAQRRGLPVRYFVMKRGLQLDGINEILQYVRSEGVDIVHSHGYKPNIMMSLVLLRKFGLVSSVHGWAKQTGNFKTKSYEFLDGLSLRRMDRVVAVSQAVVDDLDRRGLKGHRVRLIYNGIEPLSDGHIPNVQVLREHYGLGPDDYVIGAIGRLAPVKGHEYLIQAMASILPQIPQSRLLIAGEGSLRDPLQGLIEHLGLAKRAKLIGYVHNVRDFLSLIHVYVLPSLSEGMPISLLEAMAAGKPVIATSVGGIREVIQTPDIGVLVPSCDPQALANAVTTMYRDGQWAEQIGKMGRETVIGRFSSRSMADQYITLYRELVG
ncbi:MAG: glycosyltransferase [Candidatus Manganitrophus sp.]|nr:glycosyltransferase [Candidatus Manganitrophus sp.]MDC4226047.1 glycosyltransferase [Candidatus Manganitrophus sp.]WDT72698.1 MAG: glycosyltransferase [Candidatus Manganitrophus sp.]WDT75078.1 MAG: glycosyltransferase [Candidatus Manganitrophus sp.]WDT79836.1 MAG: glycosyltransferase [Candidatus Manganitrophus sp.]